MRISLLEVFLLEKEIKALFKMDIPFPLKFRLETKFVPPLNTVGKIIADKMKDMALTNGAIMQPDGRWQFNKNEAGEIIKADGYKKFLKENDVFLSDPANDIDIDCTIREDLFGNITTGPDFPSPSVISKFIE